MTKSRLIFLIASGLVVVPLLSSGLSRAWADDSPGSESRFKYLSVFTEVLGLVRQAYVEEPDLRALMAGALSGATDALDPFSSYVPPDQVKAFLVNRELSRKRSGMVLLKDRGVAWIVAVDRGGPAETAGLRRGDIVSELADLSTRSMPSWRVHQILSQPEETLVKVSVVRSSDDVDFELKLDEARPASPLALEDRDGYAYLRLSAFDGTTVEALRSRLPEVGERTLVLDVRGSAGGDEKVAYGVAGLFSSGKLGELKARDEVLQTFSNEVSTSHDGAVVLLQDRGSQGAAEVLVAVLSSRERVTVLGERSFGHAGQLGQERLSGGGLLEFTAAFYTGPDGEPITEGRVPDHVVRRRFVGEEGDADALYLEEALRVLREVEAAEKDEPASEDVA